MNRRDILKGLIGIPFLGAYSYLLFNKTSKEVAHESNVFLDMLQKKLPPTAQRAAIPYSNTKLRLGIIGTGNRGMYLMKALGFVTPKSIDNMSVEALNLFLEQADLNIDIVGICDLYQPRAKQASLAAANINRQGSGKFKNKAVKIYSGYRELLKDKSIDAVVIATSDHWHAPIAIEASEAGKHVYCEKALTHNLEDVFKVRNSIKASGITFQLGHQNRQAENYIRARQIVDAGLLGNINLVETCTNRNSPNGAWLYPIPEEANSNTIDWNQFIREGKPKFNKEHFFRWRLFWDYGTGLAGDLLTHEYDCINQVLQMGIPEKVSASGGIYHWKDKREVPDVFQVVMEYPQRNMSIMYSASQANAHNRPRLIMGNDASLEIGGQLTLNVDSGSDQYASYLKDKVINPGDSFNLNNINQLKVDAISSATEKYFASRGLLYTSQNGKMVDTTHLHLAEWLHAIRTNITPSCDINQAFEEGITAQMATLAYREGKVKRWDGERVI